MDTKPNYLALLEAADYVVFEFQQDLEAGHEQIAQQKPGRQHIHRKIKGMGGWFRAATTQLQNLERCQRGGKQKVGYDHAKQPEMWSDKDISDQEDA